MACECRLLKKRYEDSAELRCALFNCCIGYLGCYGLFELYTGLDYDNGNALGIRAHRHIAWVGRGTSLVRADGVQTEPNSKGGVLSRFGEKLLFVSKLERG